MKAIRVVGEELRSLRKPFAMPDLRITGYFDGVTVIEGGVCRECRGRGRWILERLQAQGLLSGQHPLTLILGVRPYIPEEPVSSGNTLVIGDCAVQEYRQQVPTAPGNVLLVEGCPPDTAPRVAPPWLEEVIRGERRG